MKNIIAKFCVCLILLLTVDSLIFGVDKDSTINEFLDTAKEYSKEMFPELENENILEVLIKGEAFESEKVIERILNIFVEELKAAIAISFTIISVSVLCSLLKNIQVHNKSNVGEVAFYICYLFVVTLAINSYSDISKLCVESMSRLTSFMNLITPLFLSSSILYFYIL